MASRLQKALGAVKDQTSISLAKISGTNCSNLDVAVLKATTHEELPVEDRFVNEVLLLTSSSRIYATACVHALARRINRTRNWIVALKSLTLIFRILQEGDAHFAYEVLRSMKRGSKLLNLSNFRDESNSSPWDFTAFVRTYALYLDERLDCTLMGKLNRQTKAGSYHHRTAKDKKRETKPTILLDKIVYWQRLLDRVLATRPTGAAKNNRLVQISLYTVVRESFDLYRDISDGLALVLDSFFHLHHQSCIDAFNACSKAAKQFDELASYYALCKSLGVGRSSEYPSVQKISEQLLETLEEFLKDHQNSEWDPKVGPTSRLLRLPAPPKSEEDQIKQPTSPCICEPDKEEVKEERASSEAQSTEQPNLIDIEATPKASDSNISNLDLVLFDDRFPAHQVQEEQVTTSSKEGWEMALVESATNMFEAMPRHYHVSIGGPLDSPFPNNLYDQRDLFQPNYYHHQHNYSNPFLEIGDGSNGYDFFSAFGYNSLPAPTFSVNNPDHTIPEEEDPFSPSYRVPRGTSTPDLRQQVLVQQQRHCTQHER